jgi:hypothetical protein
MSPAPAVPEDTFRVEGHCCAASLPGIRQGEEPVRFSTDAALRDWLQARYGFAPATGEPDAAPPSADDKYTATPANTA